MYLPPVWHLITVVFLLGCTRAENGMRGYYSSCDLSPQTDKWELNNGFELMSWIQSGVPYPITDPSDYRSVGFISEAVYVRAYIIEIESERVWRAYGDRRMDGWLYGSQDVYSKFIANKTYFIYPDFKVALHGTFNKDGDLINGEAKRITHYRCKDRSIELKFEDIQDGGQVFSSHRSTIESMSPHPKVRDPLELSKVRVHYLSFQEAILIANELIEPHSIVAYHNGYFWNKKHPRPSGYPSDESFYRGYVDYNSTHALNVPYGDTDEYASTLGHLVQQDPHKMNVHKYACRHPIYGEILCLQSTRMIGKGEALFMDRFMEEEKKK